LGVQKTVDNLWIWQGKQTWLVVSTVLKNMNVGWDDDIPNMEK
jgi:hypothetical protein